MQNVYINVPDTAEKKATTKTLGSNIMINTMVAADITTVDIPSQNAVLGATVERKEKAAASDNYSSMILATWTNPINGQETETFVVSFVESDFSTENALTAAKTVKLPYSGHYRISCGGTTVANLFEIKKLVLTYDQPSAKAVYLNIPDGQSAQGVYFNIPD